MFDWYEKLVRRAIHGALDELAALPEPAISDGCQRLTADQQLSTPPLMRGIGVDLAADTFQRLVRVPVTFGMQRVADGGAQRNFVASTTLLPAIAL